MTAPRRGFTLIEVLVAIGVLLVLSGTMLALTRSLVDARASLAQRLADHRAATATLEALEEAALVCEVRTTAGAGIEGTATTLRLVGPMLVRPAAPAASRRLVATNLRHDPATRTLTLARHPLDAAAPESELSRRVERLELRYHDGTAWRTSFDSRAAGRLPRAIDVAIWFGEAIEPDPDADPDAPDAVDPADAPAPAGPAANQAGFEDEIATVDEILREPDRRRVIAIPDAGDAS